MTPPAHDRPTPERGDVPREELLTRFARGDDSALGELMDRESDRLLRRLEAKIPPRLRQRLGASDILQHTAANMVSMRDRFVNQGLPAFRKLLNTVADHLLINAIEREQAGVRDVAREVRRAPRQPDQTHSTQIVKRLAAAESTPSKALMRREDAALLQRCFVTLSPSDQEIIQLIDYDEIGYEQAAIDLGISAEAARQRHHRAILRLREGMRAARDG